MCARWSRKARSAGVFLASERRLLEGVLALADRKVGSIMIPRQDVIWLDIEDPIELLWQQAKEAATRAFWSRARNWTTCSG